MDYGSVFDLTPGREERERRKKEMKQTHVRATHGPTRVPVQFSVHHADVSKRRWVTEHARHKPNGRPCRRERGLERCLPSDVPRRRDAKRAIRSGERRGHDGRAIRSLRRVAPIGRDVGLEEVGVGQGRAWKDSHVKGEEKLKARAGSSSGSVGVRNLGPLPRVRANVESESIEASGGSELNVVEPVCLGVRVRVTDHHVDVDGFGTARRRNGRRCGGSRTDGS